MMRKMIVSIDELLDAGLVDEVWGIVAKWGHDKLRGDVVFGGVPVWCMPVVDSYQATTYKVEVPALAMACRRCSVVG